MKSLQQVHILRRLKLQSSQNRSNARPKRLDIRPPVNSVKSFIGSSAFPVLLVAKEECTKVRPFVMTASCTKYQGTRDTNPARRKPNMTLLFVALSHPDLVLARSLPVVVQRRGAAAIAAAWIHSVAVYNLVSEHPVVQFSAIAAVLVTGLQGASFGCAPFKDSALGSAPARQVLPIPSYYPSPLSSCLPPRSKRSRSSTLPADCVARRIDYLGFISHNQVSANQTSVRFVKVHPCFTLGDPSATFFKV
ncbi:hypothetical protein DFJ73DRAFT_835016 [Zopfochytrium polystomum]|nr:hypothetical protein DFJ73DRAFT_835016 [Zopfochytrium polystomum]